MTGEINPIDARLKAIEPLSAIKPDAVSTDINRVTDDGQSFVDILKGQLDSVIELHNSAEEMQQKFVTGEIEDISQVVLAVQKADLALNFTLELRNKVVEAYQEISRMQI